MQHDFDYILVGGGLQNGLIALALDARQPGATWALVERAPRLGGNHTWCFHAADVDADALAWMATLVVERWPGYDVRFPGFARRLDSAYSMLTSARLHSVLTALVDKRPDCRLVTNCAATHVDAHAVQLASGETITGALVIDARGHTAAPPGSDRTGYQKFLGLEIELSRPHALDRPILMDATVAQHDGFRFVYTLPLAPRRLLVEDTYFANDALLAHDVLRRRILEYVAAMGLDIAAVQREEQGILPMPWRGHAARPGHGAWLAGYRGGFFHPGTGYSLPIAARFAALVASAPPEALHGRLLRRFVRTHRRQASFCHLLNHMLFRWFPPDERWHIMRRFYRLPLETIERFYALRLRPIDRARLVLGRPPRGMSLRYRLVEGADR